MTENGMVGWHHQLMNMSLSKLLEIVEDRGPSVLQFIGSQRVRHDSNWTQQHRRDTRKWLELVFGKEVSQSWDPHCCGDGAGQSSGISEGYNEASFVGVKRYRKPESHLQLPR